MDLIREWKEYRGKDAAVDTQMVLRENQVQIYIYVRHVYRSAGQIPRRSLNQKQVMQKSIVEIHLV